MRDSAYMIKYTLLVIAQILILNYCNFSQLVSLTLLPTLIISLPTRHSTLFAMILAFITGFVVDFTAGGLIGLNVAALVPVAFFRIVIVRIVFGEELLARGDNVSLNRLGPVKIVFSNILATALFLVVYVWADGAGTHPLWMDFTRFGCSLLASAVLSFFVSMILDPEN